MEPLTNFHRAFLERARQHGINTDITLRWVNGTPHHPNADKLAREFEAVDWLFSGDSFGLEFGGDGDSGETMLYILDIIFELRDAEAENV